MILWYHFLMEKRTDFETSNTEMVTISRAEYEAIHLQSTKATAKAKGHVP